MQEATLPENENERLQELKNYHIMDSLAESDFDSLTQLASAICQTPISLISLVDDHRQWFKSKVGLEASETPKNIAFCSHALLKPDEILLVPDSSKDERFHDNPLAIEDPHVTFYAGVPLVSPNGLPLGTLCVIDTKPNELSQQQINALKTLGKQVIQLMELRKNNRLLLQQQIEIENKNKELENFSYILSHDIKSPIHKIIALVDIIKENESFKLAPEQDFCSKQSIEFLEKTTHALQKMVDGVTHYYKYEFTSSPPKETFPSHPFFKDILQLVHVPDHFSIKLPSNTVFFYSHKISLEQVFLNLLSNAIKYNNKDSGTVEIICKSDSRQTTVKIIDNGRGIQTSELPNIFKPFFHTPIKDRYKTIGSGIGLATVAKILEKLDGSLTVESTINIGSTFTVKIPNKDEI